MKHIGLAGCLVLSWLFVGAFTRRTRPVDFSNTMVVQTMPDSTMYLKSHGAIIRGDIARKQLALVFTGDEFADGGIFIAQTLKEHHIHGSFFLTGNFYRNKKFRLIIKKLITDGNFMGVHSDQHLLYCDWEKRDSLLVTRREFVDDLQKAYAELKKWNIQQDSARFFLPPYEWYNDTIAQWTSQIGLQLVNFTPGTRSNADYTYPDMGSKYLDSETIYKSIVNFEQNSANGLNGFLLLVHIGTDPRRTDKFYTRLPKLIGDLKKLGYEFVRVDALLSKK